MASRVALVENDPKAAAALGRALGSLGYEIRRFETPGRFFDALLQEVPRAVLLGLPLPGMQAFDAVRVLRGHPDTQRICVVLLADAGAPGRAVDGFAAGADEFLVKPVDPELLAARLSSLLARAPEPAPAGRWAEFAELSIDVEGRACRVGRREAALTPIEFDLLVLFLQNADRVLTRGALLSSVWSADPSTSPRTVDKHLESLRRKLGPFGKRVETVYGVGYRLRL